MGKKHYEKHYEVNIWNNKSGTISNYIADDLEDAKEEFSRWKRHIYLHSNRYPADAKLSLYEVEEGDFADVFEELERYEVEENE